MVGTNNEGRVMREGMLIGVKVSVVPLVMVQVLCLSLAGESVPESVPPRGPGTLSVGGLRLGGHTRPLKTDPHRGPWEDPTLLSLPVHSVARVHRPGDLSSPES